MSSNNLLKWGYVNMDPEDVRVIDSNELVAQKLGPGAFADDSDIVTASAIDMQELDMPQEEAGVAALFGETVPGAESLQDGGEENAQTPHAVADAGFEEGIEAPEYVMSREEAQQIIHRAEEQAQEIIEQARQQAQTLADQAYEQAKIQGRQEGYQEGIGTAQQEMAVKEAQLKQMEADLKAKYEQQLSEMEPYLVAQLSDIYEHLIGVELAQHKSVLMYLIDHALHNIESSQTYLIHVSEQDYSYVSMQKGQLLEEGGQQSATLEVIEDKSLSKNQCLIETDGGIFDCSLSVQLDELKRKLTLLSYSQKGV